MYDRDELRLESGLHIMSNMFDSGCDGVPSCKWRVYNNAEVFDLEIDLIQDLKGASIIKVVVEGHSEMRVCDSGDKGGMFGGRGE